MATKLTRNFFEQCLIPGFSRQQIIPKNFELEAFKKVLTRNILEVLPFKAR